MVIDDESLACDLAAATGSRLLELRQRGGDQATLRQAGDRLAHEYLVGELARLRAGDAVLSEEGKDDPARLTADRVWILDPLDGTREFGEHGRTDWAVHVALWERERGGLTVGAVALPAQDVLLSTADPARLKAAGGPPAQAGGAPSRLRIVVSRSRPPAFVRTLAETVGADLVPLGSAGAKVATVVRGQADAYVHAGGQYEWDSAAPVAVARAAGLHASRIDGGELRYNQTHPWMPDIVVCSFALAQRLLEGIRSASSQESADVL